MGDWILTGVAPDASRSSGDRKGNMDRTIVRCSQGALFSTVWAPLISFKAIRLGSVRVQRCPVHHKWQRVSRVDPSTLTSDQVKAAEQIHDTNVP
jgi:hypothetical protein